MAKIKVVIKQGGDKATILVRVDSSLVFLTDGDIEYIKQLDSDGYYRVAVSHGYTATHIYANEVDDRRVKVEAT